MPRRKRKGRNCSELPRLQFVESPSNQSPPRLSPEFGAINPVTARAVPVDDAHDLSWVTPQFGDKSHHCLKQYGNQATRRTTRLRRNKSYDHRNHDPKSHNLVSKYKPLSFVTNCNSRQIRDRHLFHENEGMVVSSHNLNLNVETNNFVDGSNDSSPSASPTNRNPFPKSFRILTPVIDNDNCSGQENSNSLSAALNLRTKNKNDINGECESERLCGNNLKPGDDSDNASDNDQFLKSGDFDGDSNELSAIFDKKDRKRFPLDLSCSSYSSPPSPIPEVLVTDTPECDYDLTMRQRQMKYLLRTRPKPR